MSGRGQCVDKRIKLTVSYLLWCPMSWWARKFSQCNNRSTKGSAKMGGGGGSNSNSNCDGNATAMVMGGNGRCDGNTTAMMAIEGVMATMVTAMEVTTETVTVMAMAAMEGAAVMGTATRMATATAMEGATAMQCQRRRWTARERQRLPAQW